MRIPPPHWPAFRAGLLMHLTFSVTVLAVAVITGPPIAWILGEEGVSTIIAVLAVSGRALVGALNSRQLWDAAAAPSLVLSTTLSACLAGYLLVFLPLTVLGLPLTGSGLIPATTSAMLALVLDCIFAILAAFSGTLIASGRTKRRYRPRRFEISRLPVIREISESFAEHRAKARLNA